MHSGSTPSPRFQQPDSRCQLRSLRRSHEPVMRHLTAATRPITTAIAQSQRANVPALYPRTPTWAHRRIVRRRPCAATHLPSSALKRIRCCACCRSHGWSVGKTVVFSCLCLTHDIPTCFQLGSRLRSLRSCGQAHFLATRCIYWLIAIPAQPWMVSGNSGVYSERLVRNLIVRLAPAATLELINDSV